MRRRGRLGVCGRCGFTVKHSDLRHEFVNRRQSGIMVCGVCVDDDHPQLWGASELHIDDPRPIRDPRPETYNPGLFGWNPIGPNIEVTASTGRLRVVVE